jgi:uncharacterized protein YjbJ (UPF0337 family)
MLLIEDGNRAIISRPVHCFLERDGVAMTGDTNSTSAEHLKGSVKEALGKLTGDARIEAEGRRQKRDASTTNAGRSKSAASGRG